jgi:hypothetical protein
LSAGLPAFCPNAASARKMTEIAIPAKKMRIQLLLHSR